MGIPSKCSQIDCICTSAITIRGGGLSQCAWNRAAEHPFEYVATWARRGRRGGRDTAAIRRRPNFHTRSERMKIVLHDSTTTRLRMVVRSAGSAVTQPPRVAGSMKNRRRSTAPWESRRFGALFLCLFVVARLSNRGLCLGFCTVRTTGNMVSIQYIYFGQF